MLSLLPLGMNHYELFGKIDSFIETGSMSYNYDYAHDYDYPYAEDEEEVR